jgi:hypothetical protein
MSESGPPTGRYRRSPRVPPKPPYARPNRTTLHPSPPARTAAEPNPTALANMKGLGIYHSESLDLVVVSPSG